MRGIPIPKKPPTLFKYWDSILENETSLVHAIIGPTGSGKSTLALKYALYRCEGDIDCALDHFVFTPLQFIEKYEKGGDFIVWDDGGIWLRMIKRMHWDPLALSITSLFDVGRLRVKLVLITAVTDRDFPRSLIYNGYIYRSRTRVWKVGFDRERGKHKAKAVTQFRRERADFSKWYWDTSNEYVYKFWHFGRDEEVYQRYLVLRAQYVNFFTRLARERVKDSKLYELLRDS